MEQSSTTAPAHRLTHGIVQTCSNIWLLTSKRHNPTASSGGVSSAGCQSVSHCTLLCLSAHYKFTYNMIWSSIVDMLAATQTHVLHSSRSAARRSAHFKRSPFQAVMMSSHDRWHPCPSSFPLSWCCSADYVFFHTQCFLSYHVSNVDQLSSFARKSCMTLAAFSNTQSLVVFTVQETLKICLNVVNFNSTNAIFISLPRCLESRNQTLLQSTLVLFIVWISSQCLCYDWSTVVLCTGRKRPARPGLVNKKPGPARCDPSTALMSTLYLSIS